MGCDIHFYVERKSIKVKRNEKINQVLEIKEDFEMEWESADKWTINKYHKDDKNEPEYEIAYGNRIYDGRNYYLFSILADVRNRREEKVEPICDPKGFPSDCSEQIRSEYTMWEGDAHSMSYFTLSELLAVDWSKYEAGWC